MPQARKVDWEEVQTFVNELASRVLKEGPFDGVIAVSRGGMIYGAMLAMALGLDEFHTVKAVHYGEGKPPAELFSDPVIGEVNFSVMDKRLILADDVVSTGKTLKKVKGMLLEAGAKRILSVALYVKPSAMHIPDLFAEKEERCLLFPWER